MVINSWHVPEKKTAAGAATIKDINGPKKTIPSPFCKFSGPLFELCDTAIDMPIPTKEPKVYIGRMLVPIK